MGKKIRALSLLSGGLDSLLAVRMLEEQGIEVVGLTFTTPFFGSENAEDAAKEMKIPIRIVDISDEHLAMVKNPPHGRGKNMNPCIDCHAMMIRKAGEIAEAEGFDIV
ncbi:MAG TPA: tRNA 4-thiouridine(8) synthase ThiI, partial [bacterium]|nr:tRNA 4-thiouridine(8) synthase ThiI [bacterium]